MNFSRWRLVVTWFLVAALYLKRECSRLAESTGLGNIGIVAILAAIASVVAAVVTLVRGYGEIGSIALSMALAFAFTAAILGLVIALKSPGGVERHFAEKREELSKLQEEFSRIRAQEAAVRQREQEAAQRTAAEEASRQRQHSISQAEGAPAAAMTPAVAGGSADMVTCAKCGSSQITAQKKGFGGGCACCGVLLFGPLGLLCGLKGANKVLVTCLRCGHQWSRG